MWLTAVALAVQAALIASNISVARLSFLGRNEAPYDFPLLLGLVEACKLAISTVGCGAAAARTRRRTTNGQARVLDNALHAQQVDTNPLWLYLIPGVFYPLANSVDFLVVGVVTPGELSLLWNLKIASTAVLYRLVLKRSLHAVQWIALGTLLVGVLLVEWAMRPGSGGVAVPESQPPAIAANGTSNNGTTSGGAGAVTDDDAITSSQRAIALLIVLVGTVVSSFASIVTEFIFKRSRENIWRQNAKLYFFGILVFIATVVMEGWIRWTNEGEDSDGLAAAGSNNMSLAATPSSSSSSSSSSLSRGEGDGGGSSALPLFNGWNAFCVLLLVLKSGHGLFTSFLLKYFDVILTIHADALATVLNVVVSAVFWGLEVNLLFAFGSVLTLSSILVYHHNKGKRREAVKKAELSPEHELSVWSEHSPVPVCDNDDEDAFSDVDLESERTPDDAAEDSVFLPK